MPRLPQPGGDAGNWGQILNDYLSVEHNTDGTLKNAARPSDVAAKYTKPNDGIPKSDLESSTQATLNKVAQHDADIAAKANQTDLTATNTRIDTAHKPDGTLKDQSVTRGALAADVAAAVRPKGNRVVALGDSNTWGEASTTPGYETMGRKSAIVHSVYQGKGLIKLVKNAGVNGDTVAQMRARLATDVWPYNPDVLFVMGGTNDGGELSAIPTLTDIWDQARTRGVYVVAFTVYPAVYGSSRTNVPRFNAAIKREASLRSIPVVDIYPLFIDPSNGNWKLGLSDAGGNLHSNGVSAPIGAAEIVRRLGGILPFDRPYVTGYAADPVNLAVNGVFAVDTNADGVADNWSVNGSGGTATWTLVDPSDTEVADGVAGKWQTLTVSAATQRTLGQTVLVGFAPGDKLAISGWFKTSGLVSGGMQPTIAAICLSASDTQLLRVRPVDNFQSDTYGMMYQEFIVPEGCTKISLQMLSNGSGTGTVAVAGYTLSKIA